MMKSELYHHGILGQKWGVRRYQNKDGSLTKAGRKRLALNVKKQFNKPGFEDSINSTYNSIAKQDDKYTSSLINKVNQNSKQYAANDKEAEKLLSDYEKNLPKYVGICGLATAFTLNGKAQKMSELSNMSFGFMYDDYDQGSSNSISLYLHETGKTSIAKNIVNKSNDILQKTNDITKQYCDDVLGKYGNIPISKTSRFKVKDGISFVMSHKVELSNNDKYSTYRIGEGIDYNWKDHAKEIQEAKKIVNKLDKKVITNDSGWSKFDEAVRKLNYSDVSYEDMTTNDWNKINRYIQNNL